MRRRLLHFFSKGGKFELFKCKNKKTFKIDVQVETWSYSNIYSDEEILNKTFKVFDKSGDNELSHEEVKELCKTFGQTHTDEAIQEAIKEADADGDGKVNLEEFKAQILSRSVWSLKKCWKS